MQNDKFEVKKERFSLEDNKLYILQGMVPEGYEVEATLGGVRLQTDTFEWENISVFERFDDLDGVRGKKVTVKVQLPDPLPEGQKLVLKAVKDS